MAGTIVLVANEEFLQGRVNFVVRSACDLDLITWLRGLRIEDTGDDFARTSCGDGGNLDYSQFDPLLTAISAGLGESNST